MNHKTLFSTLLVVVFTTLLVFAFNNPLEVDTYTDGFVTDSQIQLEPSDLDSLQEGPVWTGPLIDN